MTIEKLLELRHARPFKPFALQLRDGRRVTVRRYDAFAISPKRNRIIVVEPKYVSIMLDTISGVAERPKRRSTNQR